MAADACADGEVDDAAIDFEAAVERMEAYLQAIPKFPTAMQDQAPQPTPFLRY